MFVLIVATFFQILVFEWIGSSKDSKCGFGRDFGFGFGSSTKNRSNAANRVPYRGYRGMKTRFAQLQNLSNAAVSARFGHILNPFSHPNHFLDKMGEKSEIRSDIQIQLRDVCSYDFQCEWTSRSNLSCISQIAVMSDRVMNRVPSFISIHSIYAYI